MPDTERENFKRRYHTESEWTGGKGSGPVQWMEKGVEDKKKEQLFGNLFPIGYAKDSKEKKEYRENHKKKLTCRITKLQG